MSGFELRLEKAFITAEELKQFCAELCCEEYPIPETMDRDVEEVEKHWPKFAEPGTSTGGQPATWGPSRIGRIPPFVWQDRGRELTCKKQTMWAGPCGNLE